VASEKVGREEEELLTAYSSKMVEQTTRCAIRCMNRAEKTPWSVFHCEQSIYLRYGTPKHKANIVKKLDSNGAAFLLPIVGSSNSHNIITLPSSSWVQKEGDDQGVWTQERGKCFFTQGAVCGLLWFVALQKRRLYELSGNVKCNAKSSAFLQPK